MYNNGVYDYVLKIIFSRETLDDLEVTEWLDNPVHIALLEEMALARLAYGSNLEINSEVGKERFRDYLLGRQKKRRNINHILTVVASLLLIAIASWFIYSYQTNNIEKELIASSTIAPGKLQAVLILPSGKQITLQQEEQYQNLLEQYTSSTSVTLLQQTEEEKDEVEESYNIIQVPTQGFYTITLSDNTKVWLNAESELRFPSRFTGDERHVYLKGEGYFDVTPDFNMPFRLSLNGSEIKVLGTSFNVSAYPDEQYISTTLVEGSISFSSNNQKVILTPGYQSILNVSDGEISVQKVDVSSYISWIHGSFSFSSMTLERIMRQLERWYNFKTIFVSDEIKEYEFWGTIKRDYEIEQVFKAISLTTPVEFNVIGNTVMITKE